MNTETLVLARWESLRGKHWLELTAEVQVNDDPLLLPSYSYRGDGCGGYMGSSLSPKQAIEYAGQRAADGNATIRRVFNGDAVERCAKLWQVELDARANAYPTA